MSDFTWKDYLPANARIIVNYGKGERVQFSYPREWTWNRAVWRRGYIVVMNFCFAIPIAIGNAIMPLMGIPAIYVIYRLLFQPWTETTTSIYDWKILASFGMMFVAFFGIPAIINYVMSLNREWYCSVLPKMAAWSSKILGSERQKEFIPSDVQDNRVIIPLFSNVFLNYKASGKFNDYLERVEILEMPFTYASGMKVWWLPKPKQLKTDFHWRAVFHFSKTPTTGSLSTQFI